MKVNKAPRKPVQDDAETAVEVDDSVVATEVAVEEETDTRGAELVQFALTVDLAPPPKIGRFDLLHMLGVSVLKKGVHKLPRTVAEVLQDKAYGSIL